MIVTGTIVASLKKRPERDAWGIADALLKVVNAIFTLEKKETDPGVLRDLAGASIEASKDLQAVLGVLADIIKD